MLERRHRLTSSAGFSAATRGRRAGTRHLVLHLAGPTGDSSGDPKVGFVVSRSVGDAVTRNRVKRRLRPLLRARLAALPEDAVLVVRALPTAAAATSAMLAADLDLALQRLDRPAHRVARVSGAGVR